MPWRLEWRQVEALAVVVPADQKVFSSSPGRDLHPIPAFIPLNASLPISRLVGMMVQAPAPAYQNAREYGAVSFPLNPVSTDVAITTIQGVRGKQA